MCTTDRVCCLLRWMVCGGGGGGVLCCKPQNGSDQSSLEYATAMDKADSFHSFRNQFSIPLRSAIDEYQAEKKSSHKASAAAGAAAAGASDSKQSAPSDNECIYLCGNSLGLQPKRAMEYVTDEMKKWSKVGVEGHFLGRRPWYVPCSMCSSRAVSSSSITCAYRLVVVVVAVVVVGTGLQSTKNRPNYWFRCSVLRILRKWL